MTVSLDPELRRRIVHGVLFVSGAAAVGYQVVWSTALLDFIGVGAYSYAITLATFMAGLAIASRWTSSLVAARRTLGYGRPGDERRA